jgi:hypothetical protein
MASSDDMAEIDVNRDVRGLTLADWLVQGCRAGVFMAPRGWHAPPKPWQLLGAMALTSAVVLALGRFEVVGPAGFDLQAWLAPWWGTAVLAVLVWWALPEEPRGTGKTPAWLTLWAGASLPANLVSLGLGIAAAQGVLPHVFGGSSWLAWGVYLALWAWLLAVAGLLARRLGATTPRSAAVVLVLAGVFAVTAWQHKAGPWYAQDTTADAPRLRVSQEAFEAQQALLQQTLAAVPGERPGVIDVYGLVYAPYASEDVFLRESSMVAGVLGERFDADGRTVQLVNHVSTTQTLAWATPLNLERTIAALAQRMDREADVLVVYLTSHGASNFQLAADHWPLDVDGLTPQRLRKALDGAGIRHRVIAVSACYSGGWIEPLADPYTLVMTAADATHTSYGCGKLSELTFFGRAVFDEQLRKTHSFEQAFDAAVPVIKQREIDAGKDDGFSNPQMAVGDKIGPVLGALEERLGK